MHSMQHWDDDLKKRTDQLMECVASRRDEHGAVDLKLCIEHWAFDFMVMLCLVFIYDTAHLHPVRFHLWRGM